MAQRHAEQRRRLHAVESTRPGRRRGRRLLAATHGVLRRLSGGLVALALLSCVVLLLFDGVSGLLPRLTHGPLSAAPLLLIGLAYLGLQPLMRPRPLELLKRVILGLAFILWGIDQLLRAGPLATVLGDVVIGLYVLDLGLIIKDHLQREDWDTP